MKIKTKKVIKSSNWDTFVRETYGRPYTFQQQDGCKARGTFHLIVPSEEVNDFENDTVTEEVNHGAKGVSFAAWLARDPKQKLSNPDDQADYCLDLWWQRNFYPDVQMVANDLHSKGFLEAGEYCIDIDW